MGKRVVYTDDYSGKEIAEGAGGPVMLMVAGDWYSMDLSDDSLSKLQKAMDPWISKAMSVDEPKPEPAPRGRGPAKTTRTKLPGDSPEYRAAVRAWANANGKPVGDRGRIKAEIYEAYEAAREQKL